MFNSIALFLAFSCSVLILLKYLIPKSPGVDPGTCFHPFNSHHPMDNTICARPNAGTDAKPANPFGKSANLCPSRSMNYIH